MDFNRLKLEAKSFHRFCQVVAQIYYEKHYVYNSPAYMGKKLNNDQDLY